MREKAIQENVGASAPLVQARKTANFRKDERGGNPFFSPRRGSVVTALNPRLRPWAAFLRRFAASGI